MIRSFLFLLPLLISQFSLFAAEPVELEIELDLDLVFNISHFKGNSSRLIIWLPSEHGVSRGMSSVAGKISELNSHVWLVDLHSSYMVPASRYSLSEFPISDLMALLSHAEVMGFDEIYLLSAARGAKMVLDMIYEFSISRPQSNPLKGSILIHPNIFASLPEMGQKAAYIPAARSSHLPIYLIQAEYSTKYAYTQEMRSQLETGGSAVFIHLLTDVESGFYGRPESDLDGATLVARQKLPETIQQAMGLLSNIPPGKPVEVRQNQVPQKTITTVRETELDPYQGDPLAPLLKLKNMQGFDVDLKNYQGRVVLLNFWASWCKPCVKEIPSLTRLGLTLQDEAFEILTVNIGESHQRVKNFMQETEADFPILLDRDGIAVRDWRVYAYPSSFLIDQQGRIRFAYRGALEWDSVGVIKTIESLF